MNIVSFSLTEKNLRDLDAIKKAKGFANSSEALRSAISDAMEKLENEKAMQGTMNAVLVVDHSHETEKFVSEAKHSFQQLVKSQNHHCTTGKECIDIFLLHGKADEIKKMRDKFHKNKGIKKISLVPL